MCLGQQSASQMTNADVIELASMGLSDDVILDKISSSEATSFDTSITGLRALKAAKVSDTVIRAMINPRSGANGGSLPGTPNEVQSSDPNDPSSPHDPGIYMYSTANLNAQLVLLEPTIYSQGKTGGIFASAMTYGIAKVKVKAVVQGAHASVRTRDSAVTFYFYFAESENSATRFGGSTTPGEYTLLKFEEKKNSRETVTMQMNAFGASTGTDDKANTGFTSTKVRPGVYKVTPNAPLGPGEYCFLASPGQMGAGAALRLFAFGIASPE
jgi:hypothetical protein